MSAEQSITEKHLRQIEMDGFCVVEGVIPSETVDRAREEVLEVELAHREKAAAERDKTRSRGHRVSARGVGSLRQVINQAQGFAPYLADPRIMGIAEGVFGPWVRISCTDAIVTHPGNDRGWWHADWPYNGTNAAHVRPPYPDAILHLSTIWMLSDFSGETGGTLVVPGSHRARDNPADGHMSIDPDDPYATEMQIAGPAGSVFVADSRLWHSIAANRSNRPRVGLVIRYAPWWLNLNPTHIGTIEHSMMVAETGGKNYELDPLRADVFRKLPENVKPLYRHWVE